MKRTPTPPPSRLPTGKSVLGLLRLSFGTRLLVFGLVGVWLVIGLIAGIQIVQSQLFWNQQAINFTTSDVTVAYNILQTRALTTADDAVAVANPGPERPEADLGDPLAKLATDPPEKRAGDISRMADILRSYGPVPDGSLYIVTLSGVTVACSQSDATTCVPNPTMPATYAPESLRSLKLAMADTPNIDKKTGKAEPLIEDFNAPNHSFSFDTAVPIHQRATGRVVGAVLYALPLRNDVFLSLSKILAGPCNGTDAAAQATPTDANAAGVNAGPCLTVLVGNHRIFTSFSDSSHRDLPGDIAAQIAQSGLYGGVYSVGNTTYAATFIPVPDGTHPLFYLGAERSSQTFEEDRTKDIRNTLLIALFLSVLASILIVAFVRRYVVRPLEVLEGGVSRVAAGDYSQDIPVRGGDEFARLAAHFNHMRQQISEYVAQIDRQRARLGESITALRGISQALTTTTAGEAELVRAITGAAAGMFRTDIALVALDRGTGQNIIAWKGLGASRPPEAPLDPAARAVAQVVQGDVWSGDFDDSLSQLPKVLRKPGLKSGLWAPMHYQGRVVGSIGVFFKEVRVFEPSDVATLTTLANQAAVALENTRLFEQERETVRRLQELDNMKSDFLATVQHELRTPLTAIIGMADLMEMCWITWKDDQKMEAIGDIQVSAKNLYDIVETILDFTLLESRDMGLVGQSFGVARATFEVIDDLRLKQEKQSVSITVTIPEDLELVADRDRCKQVLKHVLDNAIKFNSPGGSVVVSGGQGRGRVWVEVRDTGIGIDPEYQAQVFERFYQVDNTATRRHGGTGMGLSLARKIMEAHGGSIEVQSEVGRGATFRLVFPTTAGAGRRAGAPDIDVASMTPSEALEAALGQAGNGHRVETEIPGLEADPLEARLRAAGGTGEATDANSGVADGPSTRLSRRSAAKGGESPPARPRRRRPPTP